jgi:pyruvyltransferase
MNWVHKPVYAVVGSTLQSRMQRFAGRNLEIWGAGLISEQSAMRTIPRKVHAVRGPLTRARLLADGISCPEVFGDPAILYSLLYRPVLEDRYEVGIIPHYVDYQSSELVRFNSDKQVTIIDVKAGIQETVDHVAKCGLVASSSLHGLIIAESYGIPAVWIQISDRVIGSDFKFLDYYAATGRPNTRALKLSDVSSSREFASAVRPDRPQIDLGALLAACPFLDQSLDLSEGLMSHPMHRQTRRAEAWQPR